MANKYPLMGSFPIVPAADLLSLTAAINAAGPARRGDAGVGKRAGMLVIRDGGSGAYSLVMAIGATPASKWMVVDGSATYQPV